VPEKAWFAQSEGEKAKDRSYWSLLLGMHSRSTRRNRHKQQDKNFSTGYQEKNLFTTRIAYCWHKLPREVLKTPSLEILKI